MTGAPPQAASGTPFLISRSRRAPPPTNDTPFATMLEKFKGHPPCRYDRKAIWANGGYSVQT
jgi:hypothetical protein